MMTLTVFVQELQETKRKPSSPHNEKNKYISDSNHLPKSPLPKNPVTQTRARGLDGTGRGIKLVVS